MGRLVAETAGNDYRRYTYAPNGQLSTEENNWYRTSYAYDSAGRVTGVSETELMSAGGALTGLQSYTNDNVGANDLGGAPYKASAPHP